MNTFYKIISALIIFISVLSCESDLGTETEESGELTDGYVLYSFLGNKSTNLIDTAGNNVKTWTSSYRAVGSCYLSDNKTLLRSGNTPAAMNGTFANGGGASGIIEELDDDSNVIWSIQKDDDNYTFHHDFKEIDDNTIIALTWNLVEYNGINYWNEKVIIIDKTSNNIIWEWSAMTDGGILPEKSVEDYLHFNSVDYTDEEILVSSRSKSTLYLINRESKAITSTFTAGGTLSGQHDATFLDNGNILVYNNNAGNNMSVVLELNSSDEVVWEYSDDFYSTKISGTQRLESGNTVICSGDEARIIEVTNSGEKVWDHIPENPDSNHPSSIFKVRKYVEY